LLHTYSRTVANPNYILKWPNSIFDYKLRTIAAENP